MSAPFTPEELAELHHALELKRSALLAALPTRSQLEGITSPPNAEDADIVGDEGDASVDLEETDREDGEIDNASIQLAAVDHALAKFALGTYGLCEVCGRPIPLARLRVLPEARYDVQHEAEIEARHPQT
ncbi:MAG: TraR/DksA family transcriptional regulator [Ktedonobacterales bacterium]